ncbi:hypothetical protein ACFLVO_01930 [Chloroflexota bacterium]
MERLQGKELIELVREDPLLEYKELRSEDVEKYFLATRNPRKTALRRTKPIIRKYVLRFFEDGVNAYQYLFDNASIFYTTTAVEMGLLFKLQRKVRQAKKAGKKTRTDFKWLIYKSTLDGSTKKLTNDIRIMRNCYVHYQNIIAYNARRRLVDVPELIKQGVLRSEVGEIISNDKDNIPIRIEHLETNQEIMPFINKRVQEHINWIGSTIPRIIAFKKRNNDTKLLDLQELLTVFGIEAFDALTCIKWSFSVLKKLYII